MIFSLLIFNLFFQSILFPSLAFSKECIHPPRDYGLFEGCYERRTIKKIGSRSINILNLVDSEREWSTGEEKENSVAIVLNTGKEDKLLTSYCLGRCFDAGNPKPRVELSFISGAQYLLSAYDMSYADKHGVRLRLFVVDINKKKIEPISGAFEVRRKEKVKIKREKGCYFVNFNTLIFSEEPSSHTSGYSVQEKAERIPFRCESGVP